MERLSSGPHWVRSAISLGVYIYLVDFVYKWDWKNYKGSPLESVDEVSIMREYLNKIHICAIGM